MPFSIIKFAVTEILVKWLNVIHSHKPKKKIRKCSVCLNIVNEFTSDRVLLQRSSPNIE